MIESFKTGEEWLKWRLSHIGASETPAILGLSPFTSRLKLLKIKLGIEKVRRTQAMDLGNALEEPVRKMVEYRLQQSFEPVTIKSRIYPFMVCQLDGFNENTHIEIKCPFRVTSFNEMEEGIPLHYQYQMEHQLLVTGRKSALFVAYFQGSLVMHTYESDPSRQVQILDACEQFLADLKQAHLANEKGNTHHQNT